METTRDTAIQLAGTQVPLLDEAQLTSGVLLAGVAGSFIWQVIRLAGRDLLIQKLPVVTPPCTGEHTFAPFARGHVCNRCQMRKQAVADFLPKVANKARVHVITPTSDLHQPQPHTLYGYLLPNGQAKLVHMTSNLWSETLPVVPKLSIVWTVPPALRAMMESYQNMQPVASAPNF